MGFIVYSKLDGDIMRYYDSESAARAQVTAHNRTSIMNALKGINRSVSEWEVCKWDEFEHIFAKHYANNKCYFLQRSSWR